MLSAGSRSVTSSLAASTAASRSSLHTDQLEDLRQCTYGRQVGCPAYLLVVDACTRSFKRPVCSPRHPAHREGGQQSQWAASSQLEQLQPHQQRVLADALPSAESDSRPSLAGDLRAASCACHQASSDRGSLWALQLSGYCMQLLVASASDHFPGALYCLSTTEVMQTKPGPQPAFAQTWTPRHTLGLRSTRLQETDREVWRCRRSLAQSEVPVGCFALNRLPTTECSLAESLCTEGTCASLTPHSPDHLHWQLLAAPR